MQLMDSIRAFVTGYISRTTEQAAGKGFAEYEATLSVLYFSLMALVSLGMLLLGFVFDRWMYEAPAVIEAVTQWRFAVAGLLLLGALCRYLPLENRYLLWVFQLILLVLVSISVWLFAPLGGMELSFFQAVTYVPLTSVLLFVPAGLRIGITLLQLGVFLGGYFLLQPGIYQHPSVPGLLGWTTFGAVGSVLLGMLHRSLVWRDFMQRRQLADKEAHLMLFAEKEEILEDERIRIARDLHDELGQVLASTKLDLFALKNLVKSDEKLVEPVDKIEKRYGALMALIQQLIFDLRPSWLTHTRLFGAIEELVDDFQVGNLIRYDTAGDDDHLNDKQIQAVYRIVKEALTNATKYSGADAILVSISVDDKVCRVVVNDNGTGFSGSTSASGLGLKGMGERARRIGGTLSFDTSASGTNMYLSFEVDSKASHV